MKSYTIEEQDRIGAVIAEIFSMRKDRENKTRWRMSWGSKTNLGLFHTLLRIADDIREGNEVKP